MSLSEKYFSGYPDLLLIIPAIPYARHVFLELKSVVGKTSKIQDYIHMKIRLYGGEVHIVNSMEQLLQIL